MAIAANRYANRIYSEHPIALWPLDEQAYYLSLIDDSNRLFTNYSNNGVDRVNFCTNPSFETNTSGWVAYGAGTSISRVTTDRVFGSASVEITKAAVTNSGIQTGTMPVAPSLDYTVSAYIKVPSGNETSSVRINMQFYDGTPSALTSTAATTYTVSSADGWVRMTNSGTAPAGARYVVIFIVSTGIPTAGQKWLIDGVMIENGTSAGTYFDGSISGGAWIGSSNASASVIHVKNRVNLVPNPSLETNATGWNANAASAGVRSTAQAFLGTASYLATSNGVTNFGVWVTNAGTPISVTAGKTYTASFYVRDINTARQYASGLDFRNVAGGTTLSQPISPLVTVTNTGWTRVSITGVAPTGATVVYPWCYTFNTAPTSGTQAYFDAALFEESTIAYPYFDGAQTSISYGGTAYTIAPTWSGTAHASTSTLTQWTASNSPTIPDAPSPFDSDIYSSITKSTAIAGTVEAEANTGFGILDLDPANGQATVNAFLYQNPTYINWFKIGIRYESGGTQTVLSDEIPAPSATGWINLNKTFDLPVSFSGEIKVVLQVNFKDSTAGDTASRTIIMNGLSVGQGSSLTCYESLGSTAVDLPSELGFGSVKGISADQYGVLSDNGYYLIKTNALLASNDLMSMLYGTDNSTRIKASGTSLPSMIFPGKGVLHNNGRSNEYTLEFWLNIDPQTSESKKILGPLDSTDGVYIKEGFLSLVVGDEIGSHYVGQWYRPMLIDIVLKSNNATLLLNGEEVINIPFPRSTVELSSGRDWWGVYSYTSTRFFAIDCIAIYPYIVSENVAKRRFIYGQGTPNIQTLDAAYSGTPTVIDFATAEYGPSVIYPDTQRWDAGYFNNLDATRDYISVPDYSLPFINIGGRDINEWYDDNLTINNSEYPDGQHPKFVSLRPNQVTRTNLVNNPSFETNTTNWTATNTTLTRVSTEKNVGDFSLEIVHTTAGSTSSGVNIGYRAEVLGERTYTISAYIKVAAGTTRSFRIRRTWYDAVSGGAAVGSATVSAGTNIGTSSGWVRVSFSGTAPATAKAATFRIEQATSSVIGDTWYLDNVLFEESSSALPYFDGSYVDPAIKLIGTQAWTGTAHASTSTVTTWNPNGINYQDPSYFNFPTLNVINDQVAAVYGVFQADSDIASDRTLISFSNVTNGDTFDITLNSDTVDYSINGTSLYQEVITIGTGFLAGLHIPSASAQYGYEVSRFFSSPSSIQVYVGGNGDNTFEGKIYQVGIANTSDYLNIDDNFYALNAVGGGFAKTINYELLLDHFTSYTLMPEYEYGKLFLDISVLSEWEEYYPLSYFATYTKDENGEQRYDVDMLQLNIGYVTVESTGVWTYQDLKDEFVAPNDYADLAASTYLTYFALKNRNTTGGAISTAASSLKGYLTFQPIATGANAPLSSFTYEKSIDPSHIIYVDQENTTLLPEKAFDTRFAFVDDMLVFPPKSKPFDDYAMVIHLQVNQRSIIRNPLKIRKMEITTKGYNENGVIEQKTSIGTKYGKKLYPYVQQLGTLNNAGQKPFSISKETVPYLYANTKTGVGIRNEAVQDVIPVADTQIFIPINQSGALDQLVSIVQFMIKPEFDADTETIKLLKINYKDGTLIFSLNKDGSTQAIIEPYTESGNGYLVDGGSPSTAAWLEEFDSGESVSSYSTSVDFGTDVSQTGAITEISYAATSGFFFYQNGRYVPSPLLTKNEYTTIGIVFPSGIDFGGYSEGGITLFGGARFNNISYYLANGLGAESTLTTRVWQDVLDANGVGATLWSYWTGSDWQTVYILGQTSSYTITPEDLYDAYVGTNGNIVDDGLGLMVNQGGVKLVTNTTWSLIGGKPV